MKPVSSIIRASLLLIIGAVESSVQRESYTAGAPLPTVDASVYGYQPQLSAAKQQASDYYHRGGVECPRPQGHFPHPYDCTKFLNCDFNIPNVKSCPPGLHFNEVVQVCDWPEQAGCKAEDSGGGVEDYFGGGALLDLRGKPRPPSSTQPPSPKVQRSVNQRSPQPSEQPPTQEAPRGWPWTAGIGKPVTDMQGWPFIRDTSSNPARNGPKKGELVEIENSQASSGWPFGGQQFPPISGQRRRAWPFAFHDSPN